MNVYFTYTRVSPEFIFKHFFPIYVSNFILYVYVQDLTYQCRAGIKGYARDSVMFRSLDKFDCAINAVIKAI